MKQPANLNRASAVLIALMLCCSTPLLAKAQVTPPWREAFPRGYEQTTITIGGLPVVVELATTSATRTLGLGYRDGLEPDHGMLFVFPFKAPQTFWMKGMRFCLDIIWITDGQIVGATERICPAPPGASQPEIPRSGTDVTVEVVLEMSDGWLAAHNFRPGTPVAIPEDARQVTG